MAEKPVTGKLHQIAMKFAKTLTLLFLVLPTLACTLTAKTTASRPEAGAVVVLAANPAKQMSANPAPAANLFPTHAPPIQAVITGGFVNLRACAGVECPVIGALTGGQVVTVEESRAARDGGLWVKIHTHGGASGWVNSKFLSVERKKQ